MGGNSYGLLEYQLNMSVGTRDGHSTPQSEQKVPGWDLNQICHKCKACVTSVPTHYVQGDTRESDGFQKKSTR